VVQERYERLLAKVNDIAWQENQKQIGKTVEVLVATGEGRKDAATRRLSGRSKDNRLVHFDFPADTLAPRPGDLVTVKVTEAAPYHLIADGTPAEIFKIVRTRGGDAHDRRMLESCGAPTPGSGKVSLGIPIRSKSVL
jgi:tRNA-2-methylthio-N6-dimethylallyladenosine synthase